MFYGLENLVNSNSERFFYLIPRLGSLTSNKKPTLKAFETNKLIESVSFEQSPEQILTAIVTELAICDQIGEQVWDKLRSLVWGKVKSHAWGEVVPLARAEFGLQTGVNDWFQHWYQVKYELTGELIADIWDKIGFQVGKHVEDRLGQYVWNHIGDKLERELERIESKSGYQSEDLKDFFRWAIDYAVSSYLLASFQMRHAEDFIETRDEICESISSELKPSKISGILNIYKRYFPANSHKKGRAIIDTEMSLVKKAYSNY